MVSRLRRLTNFFMAIKDGIYPNLKKMSAPVMSFPEVQRRIDIILDKFGDVKDTASDNLLQIRKTLKSKEGAISKRANAILKQAQADGIVEADAGLSVREGKLLIPVNSASKKKIPGFVFDTSATGKTAFALNIAQNTALKYNNGVAVFSMEMSTSELGMRLICSQAHRKSL